MNIIALFLAFILFSGCSAENAVEYGEKTREVSVSRLNGNKIEQNTDFFIGADITEDINISNIRDFEEKTGKHEVYAEEVFIDEAEKAEKFILECCADGKKPYIIIKNRDGISSESFKKYADAISEAIGVYQIEVMVEVLENSYYYDESGEKYIYLAEKICDANNYAKTVWSVKSDDIIVVGKYMPKEYVDYICVNGYFESEKAADRLFSELRNHLNTDKGVIIRFGASSYSSDDCAYTVPEAKKTIADVYDNICTDEGIAGVIYMDKNIRLSEQINYKDYSITSDKSLTDSYSETINEAAAFRATKGDEADDK